jgi:hypothetical protein
VRAGGGDGGGEVGGHGGNGGGGGRGSREGGEAGGGEGVWRTGGRGWGDDGGGQGVARGAPPPVRVPPPGKPHLQAAKAALEFRHTRANGVEVRVVARELSRVDVVRGAGAEASGGPSGAARGGHRWLRLVAPLDLGQPVRVVPPELGVEELEVLVGARDVSALAEAIGVELADEGADIVVLEVRWQDVSRQRVWVAYHKGVPLEGPLDAVVCRGL